MNRTSIILLAAATISAAASCDRSDSMGGPRKVVFQAGVDISQAAPSTKLALVKDGETYHNYWTVNDKVSIFDETGAECIFSVTPTTGTECATALLSGSGVFSGETFTGKSQSFAFSKTCYAVHPRLGSISLNQTTDLLTLPVNLGMKQNQIGVKDGFPVDPNGGTTVFSGVKVGKSQNGFFKFVNVSSYIKFTLTDTNIVRVTFNTCDNSNPPFIGGGPLILDYTGDTPTISYDSATTKWGSVTLCKNTAYSEPLEPGTYYLNIMPTNFNVLRGEGGGSYFKMSLFTSDNTTKAAKNHYAKNPVNVTPGMILDLGTLTVN